MNVLWEIAGWLFYQASRHRLTKHLSFNLRHFPLPVVLYVTNIGVHIDIRSGKFRNQRILTLIQIMHEQLLTSVMSRTKNSNIKTVLERWGRLEEELEQIDFKLTKREIVNSLINICSVSTGVGYLSYNIIHMFFLAGCRNCLHRPFNNGWYQVLPSA